MQLQIYNQIEFIDCSYEGIIKAVPSRKTWRRPLMVRQPYSVAVPSTGGRLHPLSPEGKGAWGKRWSSLWLRALKKMPILGKINKNAVSFYACEQFSDIQIPSLF